jgi:hypothetical protein
MSEAVQYELTRTENLDRELVGLVRPDLKWRPQRKILYFFGPPLAALLVASALRFNGIVGREGFFAVFAGSFLGFLFERYARRLFRASPDMDRDINAMRFGKWCFSADGLSFENEMLTTTRSWRLITGVVEKDWGIFLWMGPAVISLPDDDLRTDVDRAEVLRRIGDWRAAA